MTSQPTAAESNLRADREKRRVAFLSVLAALLLTGMKIVVGLATNSLGILAEAAHSGLDLVAAIITLWAVRMSVQPADRQHTYGHGKFENFSALVETLLLLLTCVWIIYEAFHRLAFGAEAEIDPSFWAFLVVIVSIVVDVSRSRALAHVARKYRSQALEADALHFSTDVWSSSVVILGLGCVVAAQRFAIPWLQQADSLAALAVACIVIYVSVQLGRRSVAALLDSVPGELQEAISGAAAAVEGVQAVKQVRVRQSGPEVFVDVTLAIAQSVAFTQAHDIADRTEQAIRSVLPGADVVVHVEPTATSDQDVMTTVRVIAGRYGLAAHGVRIYIEKGRRWLELHLEVDPSLRLEEAHRQASLLEEELHRELPDIKRIVTHIEPAGDWATTLGAQTVSKARIEQLLCEYLESRQIAARPHNLKVQRAGGELAVSFHCTLAAETAITDAHDLTVALEQHLRQSVPELGRVVIHVEPADSNSRPD